MQFPLINHPLLPNNNITYIYSAAGEKLAKKMKDNTYQYYAGSMVYDNAKALSYILFDEGKVNKLSGAYSYEYHLKDHLGNTRVALKPNGSGTTVDQVAEYYSFGTNYSPISPDNSNKYLYNGKLKRSGNPDSSGEKQSDVLSSTNLDWYDYGARFYDPMIGRWTTIDNKAEKYNSVSPYLYALNNPIVFIDPDSNEVIIHYMGEKKMAAFNQYIQTDRGKAFVSQFLKNGERIKIINGDGKVSYYDFAGNGDWSMAHATLRFAALSTLNKDVIGRAFAFHKNSNGVRGRELIRTTGPIVSSDIDKLKTGSFELLIGLNNNINQSEYEWAETLGHESFLHSTNQANVIQEVVNALKSGNYNTDDLIKKLQRQSSNAKNEDENKNSNKKFLEYLDQLQNNIEKGKKEL